eukprot:COSAG02_NODE_566_length_20219_cov_13.531759_25_plen_60_part_00
MDRIDEMDGALYIHRYDNFVLENAEPKGSTSVSLDQLTDLIKSLGGDYKWMKDKEIEVR